jgi:AcrR family transcriptional regulator
MTNDMKVHRRPPKPRPYRQSARADAAEATARRIADAFSERMRNHWFDELTLEDVAARAGVTTRTVIRRFGGKEGLLKTFGEAFIPTVGVSRATAPGDVGAAINRLVEVYEAWGDSVVRNLAQEERHPALKPLLDRGRAAHRAITEANYAPWLKRLAEPDRRRTLDALVAATDVYVWKLTRRDMGRSREETVILLRRLVDAVLAQASAVASADRSRR